MEACPSSKEVATAKAADLFKKRVLMLLKRNGEVSAGSPLARGSETSLSTQAKYPSEAVKGVEGTRPLIDANPFRRGRLLPVIVGVMAVTLSLYGVHFLSNAEVLIPADTFICSLTCLPCVAFDIVSPGLPAHAVKLSVRVEVVPARPKDCASGPTSLPNAECIDEKLSELPSKDTESPGKRCFGFAKKTATPINKGAERKNAR